MPVNPPAYMVAGWRHRPLPQNKNSGWSSRKHSPVSPTPQGIDELLAQELGLSAPPVHIAHPRVRTRTHSGARRAPRGPHRAALVGRQPSKDLRQSPPWTRTGSLLSRRKPTQPLAWTLLLSQRGPWRHSVVRPTPQACPSAI